MFRGALGLAQFISVSTWSMLRPSRTRAIPLDPIMADQLAAPVVT
jgi:hypothetical protein